MSLSVGDWQRKCAEAPLASARASSDPHPSSTLLRSLWAISLLAVGGGVWETWQVDRLYRLGGATPALHHVVLLGGLRSVLPFVLVAALALARSRFAILLALLAAPFFVPHALLSVSNQAPLTMPWTQLDRVVGLLHLAVPVVALVAALQWAWRAWRWR